MTGSASAAALTERFGRDVLRTFESCGDTVVLVSRDRAHEMLAWLRDDPAQTYDYLTDVTAVVASSTSTPCAVRHSKVPPSGMWCFPPRLST